MNAVLMAVILTALTSFIGAFAMIRLSEVLGFTDLPNERSLHSRATPRAGGIGFALTVPITTAATIAMSAAGLRGTILRLLIAAAALAVVGLADDRWSLPVAIRLLVQFAAAGIVVYACGLSFRHGITSLAATIWIVALTNIYNFMDGIDGIAGAQALVASSCIAVVAARQNRPEVAIAMLLIAAGVSGFLVLNWPPARIFMGDVGSTFLGFSFGAWSLFGSTGPRGGLTLLVWIAALSPFLFDGIYTLLCRTLWGETLYRAHRSHLYQRLVQAGWTHRKTTLLYVALAAWSDVWIVLHYVNGVGSTTLTFAIAVAPVILLPVLVKLSSKVPLQDRHKRNAMNG